MNPHKTTINQKQKRETNMNDSNQNKGSFLGLVPLLIFLAVYFLMGIGSGSFNNFPLLIGMFLAMTISFIIKKPGDNKSFTEKVDMFCEGGGDKTLILMVIIYMLAGAFYGIAGAFYGIAGAMHATDTVTNLMLSILPSRMILPGLFLIGCVLSFSMGTSMGTVSVLLPIGLDIATKTGVSIPLVCGIVVGGAMFGVNLSFISDTTIAATTTQNIGMKEKFKANVLMVLPAVIINCAILAFWPINAESFNIVGAYNLVNLIPYIMIIALSLFDVNVIPAMGLSVAVGVVIGVMHGDFSFVECFNIIHNGMTGMEDMAVVMLAYLRYVAEKHPKKTAQLANRLFDVDYSNYTEKEMTLKLANNLEAFYKMLGLKTTLTEMNIDETHFEEMALRATKDDTAPVGHYYPLDKEKFIEVLKLAL